MFHLFRSRSCPRTAADLLKQKDAPIISLHVSRFSDATCVGFTIPHAICDVPGVGIILRAWCSLLASRAAEIPPLVIDDVLADFGSPYPTTKAGVKALRASMRSTFRIWGLWSKIRVNIRFMREFIIYPKDDCRMVFIPTNFIQRIREEAKKELGGEMTEGPWLSENDIVTAIMVKVRCHIC
jgi:hypothetical protein